MGLTNAEIAGWLQSYANSMAVTGADRFKVKAYRRAASLIESLSDSVAERVRQGDDLTGLPGIGKGLSAVIREIVATGKMASFDRLTNDLSPELREIATRPELNAKDVQRIYKRLGIHSLAELRQTLETGRIAQEFGSRMEYQIRRGLDDRPRLLLYDALPLARQIQQRLQAIPGVQRVEAVGSLRRNEETVGDLNFLVTGEKATAFFQQLPLALAGKVTVGSDRWQRSLRLASGNQVTIRWTPTTQWGLALLMATGNPAHLRKLSAIARERSIRLTPSALVRKGINPSVEEDIYAALGLSPIEPELREGRGEIAAAQRNELPKLITLDDIRGDLHMHTTASDGSQSIADMAAAAKARGYEYIAITDHSQSLKITNGLTEKRLRQQLRAIDRLNARLKGIRILKSAEVDILEDGRLDYSDDMLKELDLTICSIHSRFRLGRTEQTERILRAMDNPHFHILGHATGRLLLKRPGYDIDMERVLEHARQSGCHVEINSSPDRLDLSDEHARMAKEVGVKIAINTDAHSIRELDFLPAGIRQARRGWLTKDDVLNSRSWRALQKLLRRR